MKEIMNTCIAADIGGTKMLIAQVREDGTVVNQKRYSTGALEKQEVLEKLLQGIYDYETEIGWEGGGRPRHMGVGVNGVIDPIKGIWKKQEETDREVPVAAFVEKELGVVCHVDNDVKSAVIAENVFGAGKGCRDMVYINLGTGLAAGIIANGKLIRGTDGFAGEIGFMNLTDGKGPRMELKASGMGMCHQARLLSDRYPDSALRGMPGGTVRGQDIFELAEEGDELAAHIIDEMIRMVGLTISNLTCVLSPEVVILGGGLITQERLLEGIIGAVSPKAKQHLEKGVILTGLDPNYAGLMGAAAIAFGYQERYF